MYSVSYLSTITDSDVVLYGTQAGDVHAVNITGPYVSSYYIPCPDDVSHGMQHDELLTV